MRSADCRWLLRTRLSPQPLIVQIGANDHSRDRLVETQEKTKSAKDSASREDPVPAAIVRGFRAILIEPVPQMAARLNARYPMESWGRNVTILQAAVCGDCTEKSRTIFSVDMSNATGNWGSNTSDTRCAVLSGVKWVQEVGSFHAGHVIQAGRSISKMGHRCKLCSQALGRPLPSNCLSHVVSKNLRKTEVPCACLERTLQGETRVDFLMIDTEGFDYHVLQQYPFAKVPTLRVVYESTHLITSQVIAAAEMMRSLGYANVMGGLGKVPTVVWQHMRMTHIMDDG